MANYVDGFALPIPRKHLETYQSALNAIAAVWKEHGAIDYQEFVGDDMHLEGTRSFTEATGAGPDDVVVFGYVIFPSREVRDQANQKVVTDPRMAELVTDASGFDASRMVFGGFRSLMRPS